MQRIQNQGELLYNRIAPFYGPGNGQWSDALDNRLLNLLGVRYVMTTQDIVNQGYRLAYPMDHQPAASEVRVYENTKALPRVFIASAGAGGHRPDGRAGRAAEGRPGQDSGGGGADADAVPAPASPQVHEARISQTGLREVMVDVNVSDRGWLVLTENFFPGWKAYIRPFGAQGEGRETSPGESVEQQLPLYRADGTFRAVYLDQAGPVDHPLRLLTAELPAGHLPQLPGADHAAVAGRRLGLEPLLPGHGQRGRHGGQEQRVQVVMPLVNRGIDFAFTMLRLRILGPAGEGSYVNAINFYVVFEIVTRWGLGTLLTRDVARGRAARPGATWST